MSKRRDRAIGIINATFASIQGKDLSNTQRALALSVEQIGDAFFVATSRANFEVLQRIQYDTWGREAQISYLAEKASLSNPWGVGRVKILLPSAAQRILASWAEIVSTKINAQSWWHHREVWVDAVKRPGQIICNVINILYAHPLAAECKLEFSDGENLVVSPSAALTAPGLKFPFFVLEVATMQTRKDVLEKVHLYLNGCRGSLKTLAVLELERTTAKGYRVLLSVWRINKNHDRTTHSSPAGRMTKKLLCNAVEVYPQRSKGCIRIWMKDILTTEEALDADNESVDIELKTLHVPARIAAESQSCEDAKSE
ncbi:hypothetical protein MMC07_007452 [Pseudocyphellaria aurata]|nr:hypothetical protein [Pseudocyphellaria aurata]